MPHASATLSSTTSSASTSTSGVSTTGVITIPLSSYSFAPYPTPTLNPLPPVFPATDPLNPPSVSSDPQVMPDFAPAWATAYQKAKTLRNNSPEPLQPPDHDKPAHPDELPDPPQPPDLDEFAHPDEPAHPDELPDPPQPPDQDDFQHPDEPPDPPQQQQYKIRIEHRQRPDIDIDALAQSAILPKMRETMDLILAIRNASLDDSIVKLSDDALE
ncbi:hypothetical protein F4604DRAFT_1935276 [Suillus subluteus]|nr:hypothetical protein F4604DRAFT_1935276 [Suillus subluteus]